MAELRGVIFDLDGVIVDTAQYHYLAWKRLAAELGYELTPEDNERLKGVSRMNSLDIILDLAGTTLDADEKQRLSERKNTWFKEYLKEMTPRDIFPGVRPLIRALRHEGIAVGLASSSKNAAQVLDRLELHDQFDAVIDGTMIARAKPDPEIFLLTAKRLGLPPSSCVVIEDAAAGVAAAHAAGMKCAGIGAADVLDEADQIFHATAMVTLADLQDLAHR